MNSLLSIDGAVPLIGDVRLSGAKNSALKLIPTAMLSNDDVVLENVPRVTGVIKFTEVIQQLGGKAEWVGEHKLILNGSGLHSFEIPGDFGFEYRVACLMAAPLVFRFGKAVLPRPFSRSGLLPINRWMDTWVSLGFQVAEDGKYIRVGSGDLKGTTVTFKTSTHSGTDNAIISSLFVPGETVINNAAEEVEVDDLIEFSNLIGGRVERIEPKKIRVTGTNVFKGGKFTIQPDKSEAVVFATAAVMTKGNITIQNVEKIQLTAFVNTITKMGCKYEFFNDSMRIWASEENLLPVSVTTAAAPGFMTDWQSFITLLATRAEGISHVYDTIYTDRFDYIKDLNRMGAKIELLKPSEAGFPVMISDDSYDQGQKGEPNTVAKISGPTKLKGTRINIPDIHSAVALIVAAMSAEGKSELGGISNLSKLHEGLLDKFVNLGARIEQ
jgi:UDP-N-acetylglucosamine 1-carboxyvinyltransferase